VNGGVTRLLPTTPFSVTALVE